MEFGCFKNPCKIEVKKNIYKYDFNREIKNNVFSIKQIQLKSQKSFYSPKVVHTSEINTTFKCEYTESKNFDLQKPILLLTIKDDSDLLKITLNNLESNNVHKIANIFIIDDRPETNSIKNIATGFGCSYLSVKNTQDIFNFSMLHNLAVHVLYKRYKDLKTFILWNSDLWIKDSKVLVELLRLHSENKSTISGTKLIYPDQNFEHYNETTANTVQFGGVMFGPRTDFRGLFPYHLYRGYPPEDEKVNCNKGELFITGAFMIVDAKWFIKSGGFCPVLAIAFQDADLCLRAISQNKKIFYFGKDLELYHYESYQLERGLAKIQVVDAQDNAEIYTKLWDYKRVRQLLFKFE